MRSDIARVALRFIRGLWQTPANRRNTPNLPASGPLQDGALCLALIGAHDTALHKIRDFIGPAGGQVLLLDPSALGDEYPVLRAHPTHVVMDIEALGGIASAYTAIRRFRDRNPDVPVILMSSEFAADDLGTDRLALGDVSLRVPFTFAALDLALREAPINNAAWQNRQGATAQPRQKPRP